MNEGNSSEIKEIFNRIAPVYDQLNNWLSLGQHRIWKQMTVKWSEAKLGDTGLDLCCGSGDLALLLAKQVRGGKVIGVDFSASQLAIAAEKALSNIPSLPINWVEADVLNLPFEDNFFDCATMGYGLRNVTNIPQCLREIYRVLKPGAHSAILDFNHPSNEYLISFQQWYLENIVVPTARNFGLTKEYAYINPSLEKFPKGYEQVKLAYEAGFAEATHYAIALGMMGVLVVKKSIN